MKSPSKLDQSALDNCDKEPIHIPGHIQDFAILIALDSKFEYITHCSANADGLFDRDSNALIGSKFADHVNADFMHELNNALSLSSAYVQRERVCETVFASKTYEVWAHYSSDCPVLEFELLQPDELSYFEAVRNVTSLLSRLKLIESTDSIFEHAVQGLRDLTGFDRVMFYRFDLNGDGEVKAESKGPRLETFFGLRFPRWDIPKQAREIMVKLPMRTIADVDGQSVELRSNQTVPLDLSLAASRGQSPVHREYLRNMGVGGTMTLSIVIGGELWGLFAFHHQSPRCLGPGTRSAAELFIKFFAMMLENHLEKERGLARLRVLAYEKVLFSNSETANSFIEMVASEASSLTALVEADGIAVLSGNDVSVHGSTPPAADINAIFSKVREASEVENISTTTSLSKYGLNVAPCAGALVVSLNEDNNNAIVFFRLEAVRSVTWAGTPDKKIIQNSDGPRLIPRGSFKAYTEAVKNHSKPWGMHSIASAAEIRTAISKAEFKWMTSRVERKNAIYIDELNHRVRNIFALVRSLVLRTKENSLSIENYTQSLNRRIDALSAAHDLAVSKFSTGVAVNDIFQLEAHPFLSKHSEQLKFRGDPYCLQPDHAPIFALIAHELMTNCVKHGSLSVPNGGVTIDISREAEKIAISWQESGGPAAVKPDSYGFGMSLISEAIPYELDGECDIEFSESGFKIEFLLPIDLFSSASLSPVSDKSTVHSQTTAIRSGCPENVLIVEDSLMVAIDMAEMLNSFGVKEVQKCGNVLQARNMLKTFTPDFALLDISLRSEKSFEIAGILAEKKIPFCFASGYGSKYMMPKELQNIVVLTKPVKKDTLESTIEMLYGTTVP